MADAIIPANKEMFILAKTPVNISFCVTAIILIVFILMKLEILFLLSGQADKKSYTEI